MTVLRMAVVGVGSLGRHHAAKLAGFDDTNLIGVVDPAEKQGREVAERTGTNWYRSVDDLPERPDAVVIAAPTRFHLDAASHFLKQGVAAFVEKPLASTLSEARQLLRLAERHGAILQVGHIERFNPAFTAARERCGMPLYIRCQRVSPYSFRSTDIGAVHDLMIHDIDLVLALTDARPESVEAFGAVAIGPHEDMAVARLRMSSGTIVDLTCSRLCPHAERSLLVWGSDGCVEADLQSRRIRHWQPERQFRSNPALIHSIVAATPDPRTLKDRVFGDWIQEESVQASADDAMSLELRAFVHAAETNSEPEVSGAAGVQAMEVADRILTSLQAWNYQTNAAVQRTRRAA